MKKTERLRIRLGMNTLHTKREYKNSIRIHNIFGIRNMIKQQEITALDNIKINVYLHNGWNILFTFGA